jgi:hypothetical protein
MLKGISFASVEKEYEEIYNYIIGRVLKIKQDYIKTTLDNCF